ncbi:molybdopterin molybdotransferase MoeA [Sphingorhabdus soli]|uniref:Molybdopterin molybdenumtransferase n=1 Tax=Flavisphingopyxis soli TaxID=2601267 RepID=A0A5C6U6M0_9SPHN|nr:molybdopterin molybdotransferase MoeA [Sphingorhabdus soli]TXC68110.1 molybdopterin molybdotransferase MoeA [Sphingorhabdus soli]
MISFDEAFAAVRAVACPTGSAVIPIGEAEGRTLAAAVHAEVDSPWCDVSAMDGYAVRDADLSALPARLPVATRNFAGSGSGGTLAAGTCVRIFTGAPVPLGADRVVIQEHVETDGDTAGFARPLSPVRHIRPRGGDFERGALLLEANRRIGYRELVAIAGGDVAEVACWRRPRIMLLGTGDELAAPGEAKHRAGAVPESVSLGVGALAHRWGAHSLGAIRLPDELAAMERAAEDAVASADLVIVTGGASVGEKDFAKAMFERQGLDLIFSKVAIKPGKPVWLGRAGGALVMGLPGNPTSAMVTARLLLAPLIAGLCGRDPGEALRWKSIALAAALPPCGSRETFVRAAWKDGRAVPLDNQDSGAQRSLAAADLLLRRRADTDAIEAGVMVEAVSF